MAQIPPVEALRRFLTGPHSWWKEHAWHMVWDPQPLHHLTQVQSNHKGRQRQEGSPLVLEEDTGQEERGLDCSARRRKPRQR